MTLQLDEPLDAVMGSQSPRLWHVPEYVTTAGEEAVEVAALAGLRLDPWEASILIDACGERTDGKWAAFEVGLNVPRQNGKGSIFEGRELAGMFAFGELLLIHSAHLQVTSTEHFLRLLRLIEGVPEFDRRVMKVSRGKGAEAIELRGSGRNTIGSRIFFRTRSGGGGRGLTGDFVALDEAMFLPVAVTADLVPTMAARSVHGNPQLWYAGSAVDQQKHEHGVVFARVRRRGLAKASRLMYVEYSAPGDDPQNVPAEVAADPRVWAQANPGMGIRISQEHIANEQAGALGPREFAVERLGIGDWPADDADGDVISLQAWDALADRTSTAEDPVCIALDVRPDRGAASIAAAGRRPGGGWHVEVIEHRPGLSWLPERVAEIVQRQHTLCVKLDPSSPAGALLVPLRNLGVEVSEVKAREYGQACGQFFDRVEDQTLHHLGTPELRAAVKGAAKRSLGDAWAWSRRSSAVDISPLVAVTLALAGALEAAESVYESRGILDF